MFLYLLHSDPVLILAAVVPAAALLAAIYRADKLEKEPPRLLILLLFMGLISTALASAAEQLGMGLLSRVLDGGTLHDLLLYFVVVAGAEEGFKYLVLRRRTWNHPAFDCQFDGVVYAVFISLGFALWENIGYVAVYGFGTAVARALTAVPGHACFGVFMGAWYGQAKRWSMAGDETRSRRSRRMALLQPVLLHGTYDFVATRESMGYTVVFLVFVLALYVVVLRKVRRLSREDDYLRRDPRQEDPWDSGPGGPAENDM